MKLKKRIAAMSAAAMMAVSMMSVSASAETYTRFAEWKIINAPGGGGKSVYNKTVNLYSKYGCEYVVENCEKFISGVSNTYVTVTPTIRNKDNKKVASYTFARENIYDTYGYSSSSDIVDEHDGWMRYFADSKTYDRKSVSNKYTISLKYSGKNIGIYYYCYIDGTVFIPHLN